MSSHVIEATHPEGIPLLRRLTDMRAHAFALSLIFAFMIPWEGVSLGSLGTIAKYVGILAAGYWSLTVLRTGRVRQPTTFHLAFLAFFLWNALSLSWSKDQSETLDEVLTWAQLFVFIFMMWDLYDTRPAIRAGLQAYVLGAYVAIGSSLSNFSHGAAFYTHYSRFAAGDTNPDGFGFILAMGVPVAWYLASSAGSANSIPLTMFGRLLRILNFAYIPAAFMGISLSGTRTALIATLPAMGFGLSSLMRLNRWARIAVLAVLASSLLLLLPQLESLRSFQRFGTIIDEVSEGDLNERMKIWKEGMASFEQRPLLGVGTNMYRSINSFGKVAHNTFLSVLVELGLVGLTLFGVILVLALIEAVRQPGWDKSFWLSLLAVWAIGASTLTWEYRKSTWLFMSLVVASAALVRPRVAPNASRFGPRDLL